MGSTHCRIEGKCERAQVDFLGDVGNVSTIDVEVEKSHIDCFSTRRGHVVRLDEELLQNPSVLN